MNQRININNVAEMCAIYSEKMESISLTEYEVLLYEQCCNCLASYLKAYDISIQNRIRRKEE